jgi:hypothetical protein
MGKRTTKKLKVTKETLRQLDPDQLALIQGGGGTPKGDGNTELCVPDELVARTRRCAC